MAVLGKVVIIASLLLLLSLHLPHVVEADQLKSTNEHNTLPKTIDCGTACTARCELSKRPRLCKRACGTCCFRCQCVPAGTSGNADACPCYASMTTHANKRKCP